jgi:serine protease Do
MKSRWKQGIAAVAVAAAATVALFVGDSLVRDVKFARAQEAVQATRDQLARVEDLAAVFRDVGQVVEPSVVQLEVRRDTRMAMNSRDLRPFDDDLLRRFFPDLDNDGEPDLPDGFFDGSSAPQISGTGSGVIVDVTDDGYAWVITNNHVAGNAREIVVTLADGRQVRDVTVVGTDPKTDLALVKFKADRVIAAKWGDSDVLRKGDIVMAFGSPFGYVGSMSQGIVSALNRDAGILRARGGYENFIQTDAAINPGNSGGPLVNLRGEVIGINTAIASRTGRFEGIGFAIPSNQAKFVYDALRSSGKVTRGYLGVQIGDLSNEQSRNAARERGYEGETGVFVSGVQRDTPASGILRAGDVIVGMAGKPVKSMRELRNAIAAMAPGTEVELKVFRDGSEQTVKVTLGEQPEDLSLASRNPTDANPRSTGIVPRTFGMQLVNPSPEQLEKYGLDENAKGALITSVQPGSTAARFGLQPGDLITKVGKQPVTNAQEASEALKTQSLANGFSLELHNRTGERFLYVKGGE